MFLTDEQIEEELRQLEIPDGDEETDHADTQYSDYPENIPLTLPAWMYSDEAIYWINRAQEIFPDQDIKIQVGE